MKLDLLFDNCPFITGTGVTLSRLSVTDSDMLWEMLSDKNLMRLEREAPAESHAEIESRIAQADGLFEQRRAVTLGVYANQELGRLLGWIEIGAVDTEVNALSLRCMFSPRCVGTAYPTAALSALVRYLFEMVRVNRVQTVCHSEDYDKGRLLEKAGFSAEGTMRDCTKWDRHGVVGLTFHAMLASDYLAQRCAAVTEA